MGKVGNKTLTSRLCSWLQSMTSKVFSLFSVVSLEPMANYIYTAVGFPLRIYMPPEIKYSTFSLWLFYFICFLFSPTLLIPNFFSISPDPHGQLQKHPPAPSVPSSVVLNCTSPILESRWTHSCVSSSAPRLLSKAGEKGKQNKTV